MSSSGSVAVPDSRLRRLMWPAVALAALVVAAAGWIYRPGLVAPQIRQLTFRQGTVINARFAPDGQGAVYGASWDGEPYRLYSTRLDSYQSRPVDLPDADLIGLSRTGMLALSPGRPAVDGFQARGLFAEVELAGGAPRVIQDGVVGVDWGPDGELAAVVRQADNQFQLEFPVGTVVHQSTTIGQPACPLTDGTSARRATTRLWLWLRVEARPWMWPHNAGADVVPGTQPPTDHVLFLVC